MDIFMEQTVANAQEEDTQKDKFLTFTIGRETYGIDILFVTEIIGMQSITILPELPDYMKGIINLRGRIIPVMDVRLRFKQAARDYNERTCIIIVDANAISFGLIVDAVAEVITIPEQNTVAPPSLQGGTANRYIKAIGKVGDQVKLLLDCEKLLTAETIELLEEAI
jgi:purine-binding chemotaxis protein CheW